MRDPTRARMHAFAPSALIVWNAFLEPIRVCPVVLFFCLLELCRCLEIFLHWAHPYLSITIISKCATRVSSALGQIFK
jgi:hypothetical protein